MALPSFDLTDGAFFVRRASFLPAHICAAKAVSSGADDRSKDSFLCAQGKLAGNAELISNGLGDRGQSFLRPVSESPKAARSRTNGLVSVSP
jgi:hypothetical protein